MGRARTALVLTGSVLALGAAAPSAHAAFSLSPCNGTALRGAGASFQASAQVGFSANFRTAAFCGSGAPSITYDASGSGAGRRALGARSDANPSGARDAVIRFGASDEPPSAPQTNQMQKGPVDGSGVDVVAADDGILHVIPVAVGANVVDVNFPDGCTIPTASLANPPATGQDRIKLTAVQAELAFAADTAADTWGELLGGVPIAGAPTDAQFTAATPTPITDCALVPVRRVVRFDDSGTSFLQKDWLGKVNPSRGWSALLATPNTNWPNTRAESKASSCPLNSNLCKGPSNGNGPLLDLLNNVDGGIGYADIASSRDKGFDTKPLIPATAEVPEQRDTTFWTPIVNSAGTAFEPTVKPDAWKSGTPSGDRGSNCNSIAFSNVPTGADPTLGSWAGVSGVGAKEAAFYPVCSLTYILAFDDNSRVYGNSTAEEGRARTLKDFLVASVSNVGQATLAPLDYSPLPTALAAAAQAGVNAIGWNKGGGSPPSATPPPAATPPPPLPPAVVPPAAPPAPSNAFTITKVSVVNTAKGVSLKLTLQLPSAGPLAAVATSSYKTKKMKKRKKVTLGKVSGKATAAGPVKVTIKVGTGGLLALKIAKRLAVAVKVTYTPTGGTANTATKKLTLKLVKKKVPKKKAPIRRP